MQQDLIIWMVLYPLPATVLGSILAVAAGFTWWVLWAHYRVPGWHRFAVSIKWQGIDPPETCPECGGVGMVDKDKNPIPIDPLKQGEEFQHLAMRHGTGRDCGACLGWGNRPRRLPKPPSAYPGRVPPRPKARS